MSSSTCENSTANQGPILAQVVQQLEKLYPLTYAESWDHPGLIVGDLLAPVHRIYCAVDPSLDIIREAIDWNADLLITHHPLFFRSVHQVSGLGHRGAIVRQLESHGIALWVGHTNADAAHRGVSQALADRLSILDQKPLIPIDDPSSPWNGQLGEGRVGHLPRPLTLRAFADRVNRVIPPTQRGVDVAGDLDMPVSKVVVLGGSGDSFFDQVRATGADVYVTSDLRHHPVLDEQQQADEEALLRARGIKVTNGRLTGLGEKSEFHSTPAIINTPHYASEKVWFDYAIPDISHAIERATGKTVTIKLSQTDTDPFTLHLASPVAPVMPNRKATFGLSS
jgi:dinuclear metal center YbgI/SA1388 family protein